MIAVIVNPISGAARPSAGRSRAELAAAIVGRHGDAAEVFVTERPGQARELARTAVSRGARLVIAWGGDGTINEVASVLAFGDVPLGIVPAGSGNGLARQLGIDRRPDHAIRDAIAAEERLIDVGEVDDRRFVNVAGIGIDAEVARLFNERGRRRRGLLTYVSLTARALVTYVPSRYTIETPEERRDVRAVLVSVANSPEFGNGARIAPTARIDDGLLDLVVVEERSRLRTVCHLPRLFSGSVNRMTGCTIRQIRTASIESDRPMRFHVDGEPATGGTRLRVRVHPRALRVCVR
jgi:YegS/Rv2252/BmrU family lipid kinase